MIFMHGHVNGNGQVALTLYQESFPNQHRLNHEIFAALLDRLAKTGTAWRKNSFADKGKPRICLTASFEEAVLDRVAEN